MMKKTKQRYVELKLTSINVYTCILLNATVSGTIFEILISNGLYLGKTTWAPSIPPLQSQSWRWPFFYFLQEAWKWHNVVCGKREMASSFFFQVNNVDRVGMLLRTLNVLTTILLLIVDLLIWFNKGIELNLWLTSPTLLSKNLTLKCVVFASALSRTEKAASILDIWILSNILWRRYLSSKEGFTWCCYHWKWSS